MHHPHILISLFFITPLNGAITLNPEKLHIGIDTANNYYTAFFSKKTAEYIILESSYPISELSVHNFESKKTLLRIFFSSIHSLLTAGFTQKNEPWVFFIDTKNNKTIYENLKTKARTIYKLPQSYRKFLAFHQPTRMFAYISYYNCCFRRKKCIKTFNMMTKKTKLFKTKKYEPETGFFSKEGDTLFARQFIDWKKTTKKVLYKKFRAILNKEKNTTQSYDEVFLRGSLPPEYSVKQTNDSIVLTKNKQEYKLLIALEIHNNPEITIHYANSGKNFVISNGKSYYMYKNTMLKG